MTLQALNRLDKPALAKTLHDCCGSNAWVNKMLTVFPVPDAQTLFAAAWGNWHACAEADWREAFSQHPKIGEKTTNTVAAAEQAGARIASTDTLEALAEGNLRYEKKFGYIYIVFASGKSAWEMLEILNTRLNNRPEDEILIAMAEQEKITRHRLEKLLHE